MNIYIAGWLLVLMIGGLLETALRSVFSDRYQ